MPYGFLMDKETVTKSGDKNRGTGYENRETT